MSIMEYVWLIVAIAFLILGMYTSFAKGLKEAGVLYLIVVVAMAMFSMRRSIRKSK